MKSLLIEPKSAEFKFAIVDGGNVKVRGACKAFDDLRLLQINEKIKNTHIGEGYRTEDARAAATLWGWRTVKFKTGDYDYIAAAVYNERRDSEALWAVNLSLAHPPSKKHDSSHNRFYDFYNTKLGHAFRKRIGSKPLATVEPSIAKPKEETKIEPELECYFKSFDAFLSTVCHVENNKLKKHDIVSIVTDPRQGFDRFATVLEITEINGEEAAIVQHHYNTCPPDEIATRFMTKIKR